MFKEIIRKRGDKYVVLSKDGKKLLGTHNTRADALKQLKAIEISKSRRGEKMSKLEKLHKELIRKPEAEKFKEEVLVKEQNDPVRICGNIWFNGTPAQRKAFKGGTKGRGTDDKPPKAWWDDCIATISK